MASAGCERFAARRPNDRYGRASLGETAAARRKASSAPSSSMALRRASPRFSHGRGSSGRRAVAWAYALASSENNCKSASAAARFTHASKSCGCIANASRYACTASSVRPCARSATPSAKCASESRGSRAIWARCSISASIGRSRRNKASPRLAWQREQLVFKRSPYAKRRAARSRSAVFGEGSSKSRLPRSLSRRICSTLSDTAMKPPSTYLSPFVTACPA
mmetsp:Transcript_16500/g.50240  ORF Transcript_16500/g.50240 Transcript_16500/m.50240 type:complete len:222 (-) Transcript_16500:452-1117(-)